jgi:hypothetical protein
MPEPEEYLDKLDWADSDPASPYEDALARMEWEWGDLVRSRVDEVGRDAVIEELREVFGL